MLSLVAASVFRGASVRAFTMKGCHTVSVYMSQMLSTKHALCFLDTHAIRDDVTLNVFFNQLQDMPQITPPLHALLGVK